MYAGEGIALPLFTWAIDGGEWPASCPGHFNPGENASGTHLIKAWMGPRAGLKAMENRKIYFSC
jgi:hypothetical protein